MPNKVYINPETAITWSDAGATNVIDLGGLSDGAVRVGAQHDLGSSARSDMYEWRLKIDGFDSAPVVGETIDLYFAYADASDNTLIDGDVGTSDAAGATADLPNLQYAGSVVVQTTTAGDDLVASGIIQIASRYVSPVVHNNTADALLGTSDDHWVYLTPVPAEVQ